MFDGLNEIELECIEDAILVETIDANRTRTMKLNIPKLMPLVDVSSSSRKETLNINSNMVLNDPSSIPTIDYKLKSTNYISVPIANSCFRFGEDEDGRIMVESGTHITLIIPNKNIKNMKATDF